MHLNLLLFSYLFYTDAASKFILRISFYEQFEKQFTV